MLLKIYPDNPDPRKIETVVECLRGGGVIIYPTDTVYSFGCDVTNNKALQRVAQIKGVKVEKHNFSLVCYDLSHLSEYARSVDTPVYKLMKKSLPGPYTFILNASNNVPKLFQSKKKEVGIRIPDNTIARSIVKELGNPIIATSVHDEDDIIEYTTDPELMHEKYEKLVDMVIDGGYGKNTASTIINVTTGTPEVVRLGIGEVDF